MLGALHAKAFDAYRNSNNLKLIIERVQNNTIKELIKETKTNKDKKKEGSEDDENAAQKFKTNVSVGLPIKPMLARQTKSTDEVFERCPNGVNAGAPKCAFFFF